MAQKSQDGLRSQKSTRDVLPLLDPWARPPIESGLEVASPSEHDTQYVNLVDEGDKEAINQDGKEVVAPPAQLSCGETSIKDRRLCGLRWRSFWILLAAAIFLIALGIGLGVGLSSRDSQGSSPSSTANPSTSSTPSQPSATVSSDPLKIGGALDESYYSSSGAWNGTATARAYQNFAEDFEDALPNRQLETVLYYQHHSGEIRWLRQTANKTQTWQPGPRDTLVVASDAKDSTPITTVHIFENNTAYWHVFYVDSSNQVRQRTGTNRSTGWTEGSAGNADLKVYNADLVSMAACWGTNDSVPIRLFYASSDNAFEEYLWRSADETWHWQRTWEGYNGAAGVCCYRGAGSNRYLGLINLNSELEIWYEDKAEDPPKWYKSISKVKNFHPASSLALSEYAVIWQENATNRLKISPIVWQGRNTRTTDEYSPPAQYEGVPGTRITAMSSGQLVNVFYQRNGDDITLLSRNLSSNLDSNWEPTTLPV